MIHDEEETPRSDRRPAQGDESTTRRTGPAESSWVGAVAVIGEIASVAFLLQHVASVGQPSVAPDPKRAAASRSPTYLAKLRFLN